MALAGTGMFGKPLELLRTLLASLEATQLWMGVGEIDPSGEALKRIYINQFDEPEDNEAGTPEQAQASRDARPLIVIGHDSFESNEEGTETYWPKRGVLWADFEEIARNDVGTDTSSNTVTDADALMHVMNAVGEIMEAAEAAVSTTNTDAAVDGVVLDMVGYEVLDQAGRTEKKERKAAGGADLAGMKLTIRRKDL